ncbi:hypothetical protein MPTK1_7g01880 [Marchantia polymorpha subsp. ruderalis]|uniref:Protein kinase domain-containing protein n=2 Tax=Marchantia polymorpha TaxID=3197 RepID=A0AAF6BV78_MARPO|nr:hypothetical protein MARPO_0099s0061 [Marchantia polymorpha]BBN15911.1 hypothetical protein Mp_7g01880 [Marchantia polymorpha subsp. ruderalis]PTQ32440.1 hypothetical protein MARPO_0099s0061 [Marchantia polymorpha]PTQ32441.1 hypothetical protein MARPO_0099s0061 [Marchantia polymorpha]BBN15912.1 hypothetical protein Mp_7g01880 [Marchantia polymorpha subsp. ruderalis]|eukprot:PTQ32439.1 hypothetical protein MARPO_0099s0061 [Marchantia polymorpha]
MEPIVFGFIGAASVIVVALLVLIFFQLFLLFRHKNKEPILPLVHPKGKESSSSFRFKAQDRGRVFSFKEAEEVSEGFSNHIGDGTTYLVFKGILPDGTEVAIKRMRGNLVSVSSEETKFQLQVDLLYRVHHQHIINLIGYCDESPHRMLFCQYAPNGSLFEMLHGDEIQDEMLTWKQRTRIVMGIAYGLTYLHHSCNPPIIHGELTSVNIMLTEDFAAKINGLGKVPLLRSSSDFQSGRLSTNGDPYYDNPPTDQRSLYSRASDVYSFGVLLLELLTGKVAYSDELGPLAEWANPYLVDKGNMPGMMDCNLKNVNILEFCAVSEVARLCTQSDSPSRPLMSEVLDMLHQIINISVEVAAPISSPVTLRGLMAAFT